MADELKSLTVRIREQLIRQSKSAAAMAGKTMPQWVEEALTAYLKQRKVA